MYVVWVNRRSYNCIEEWQLRFHIFFNYILDPEVITKYKYILDLVKPYSSTLELSAGNFIRPVLEIHGHTIFNSIQFNIIFLLKKHVKETC